MTTDDDFCDLLPEPDRHTPVDEFVDEQQCHDPFPHTDHEWSIDGHVHAGLGYTCQRWCMGVDE